jgi:hypothetical protein
MYRCRQCRRLASVSVRDVCTTIGCGGLLEKYVVSAAGEDDDHYRNLYWSLNPVPLSANGHTGQLTSIEAAEIQQRFLRGEVNALSCSTTFELGVDFGRGVYRLPDRELISKYYAACRTCGSYQESDEPLDPSARPAMPSTPVCPDVTACPSSASSPSAAQRTPGCRRRGAAGTA